MARIGFKLARYNKIVGDKYADLEAEGAVPLFEKVIDEKFAPEFNSAELYANDGLAESDYSFKKGTLTLTVADDNDALCAELLGNKKGIGNGEVISTVEDVAPEFGYGHIIPKVVGGVKKFKVEFFPRVKFIKITSDNKTRGEGVEFSTTTIEGVVMPLEAEMQGLLLGEWERHETFSSIGEAEIYLGKLLTSQNLQD